MHVHYLPPSSKACPIERLSVSNGKRSWNNKKLRKDTKPPNSYSYQSHVHPQELKCRSLVMEIQLFSWVSSRYSFHSTMGHRQGRHSKGDASNRHVFLDCSYHKGLIDLGDSFQSKLYNHKKRIIQLKDHHCTWCTKSLTFLYVSFCLLLPEKI